MRLPYLDEVFHDYWREAGRDDSFQAGFLIHPRPDDRLGRGLGSPERCERKGQGHAGSQKDKADGQNR